LDRAPSFVSYQQTRSFGSLDGLRALSIIAVVYHHAQGQLAFGKLSGRGFLGVDLFFVISGFLIVTLLLRERSRTGDISLRHFVARRALRIMPLYYGVIVLSVVLFVGLRGSDRQGQLFLSELPYYLTYTTNWFHPATLLAITWSLSAEEQFYLVWPPIEKYLRGAVVVAVVLVGLSQVIQLGLIDRWLLAWFGWSKDDPAMLRETTFTPILLGVIVAHVMHTPRGFARLAGVLGGRAVPAVLLLVMIGLLAGAPDDIRGWPRPTLQLMMAALVISCTVREDHVLAGLFQWAPVRRIGALSYGIYLWHMFVLDPVMRVTKKGWLSGYLLFPVTLALSVAVAQVSYSLYEERFLRLRERFRDHAPARPAG
jgi:peptidoglycan/LPS O-acetylase OafA/YrhL